METNERPSVLGTGGATAPLRLALIGCGNVARLHVRALANHRDTLDVVATCDVDGARAEATARELGARRWYSDHRQALADPEVEAVDLCVTHDQHARVTADAAGAGKHVLVEKPMATSLAECQTMIDAADRAGVVLMVAQFQRFVPVYRGVKRLIDEGRLGRVRAVRFDALQDLATIRSADSWLFDGKIAGGGTVISVLVHRIDLVRYLVGEVRRVVAWTLSDAPFRNGAENFAAALLEFENGALGEAFATYSGVRMPYYQTFMIFGDEGAVHELSRGVGADQLLVGYRGDAADPALPPWARQYAPGLPVEPDRSGLPSDDGFVNELLHFHQCCRTGREPLTSGRDNLQTMRVVFAIYESSQTGRPVTPAELAPAAR